jgi:hypothetical protein
VKRHPGLTIIKGFWSEHHWRRILIHLYTSALGVSTTRNSFWLRISVHDRSTPWSDFPVHAIVGSWSSCIGGGCAHSWNLMNSGIHSVPGLASHFSADFFWRDSFSATTETSRAPSAGSLDSPPVCIQPWYDEDINTSASHMGMEWLIWFVVSWGWDFSGDESGANNRFEPKALKWNVFSYSFRDPFNSIEFLRILHLIVANTLIPNQFKRNNHFRSIQSRSSRECQSSMRSWTIQFDKSWTARNHSRLWSSKTPPFFICQTTDNRPPKSLSQPVRVRLLILFLTFHFHADQNSRYHHCGHSNSKGHSDEARMCDSCCFHFCFVFRIERISCVARKITWIAHTGNRRTSISVWFIRDRLVISDEKGSI